MAIDLIDTVMLSGEAFDRWESTYTTVQTTSSTWGGGGGGGFTLLETVTATNQSEAACSALDSSYDLYLVNIVSLLSINDGYDVRLQVYSGAGYDSGASDYTWGADAIGAYGPIGSGGASFIRLAYLVGKDDGEELSGHFFLRGARNSSYRTSLEGTVSNALYWNGGQPRGQNIFGWRSAKQDDEYFRIYSASGNITATFEIYGI